MTFSIITNALGGLALFLLAMLMMTDGATAFAGRGLKQLLGRWTSTPWRGVGVGVLVTGLVQSSSAITVATIGFVNAGVLTLRQALGVVFGANVGTTMTAWLVSLVGVGFKIEAFALPILTVGVVLHLMVANPRYKGLGKALAGFGLFFLGLAILKDAFSSLADAYGQSLQAGDGNFHVASFLLAGFIATLLTQSSSAAIAIILTAASGGILPIESAAAAVIGANIGTTSTAAFAALKATPAAKRLALGHIIFNVCTAVAALILLPLLMAFIAVLAKLGHTEGSPATLLAIFHSVFNLLGVVLMLPLGARLANFLEKLFKNKEEDIAKPQYLDYTLMATPVLAIAALQQELQRLERLVTELLLCALNNNLNGSALNRQVEALSALVEAITAYIVHLRPDAMEKESANALSDCLYAARYWQDAASAAPKMRQLMNKNNSSVVEVNDAIVAMQSVAQKSLTLSLPVAALQVRDLTDKLRVQHRESRHQILAMAIEKNSDLELLEQQLEALDATRLGIKQWLKAMDLLSRTLVMPH